MNFHSTKPDPVYKKYPPIMDWTLEEVKFIPEFRKRVSDLEDEEMKCDETLIRFLRARDGDLDKAEGMLRKSAKWFRENNVFSYRTGQGHLPPSILTDDFSVKVLGTDFEGYPVIYTPIGRWNMRDRINDGYLEDIMQGRFYSLEGVTMNAVRDSGMGQFVCILDLEEVSFYKVAHVETINVVKKFLQDLQDNYPERLRSVHMVNTPWIISYILTLFKPCVSSKTLDKVILYEGNKSKWLSNLKTHIPAEILPITLTNLE